jgi:hypothetical protein
MSFDATQILSAMHGNGLYETSYGSYEAQMLGWYGT